nr:reverse transcriptase domain-containing protein [Tanacetum cinerariifolium]
MANTTPIVTTVTKPTTNPGREKTSRDTDVTPRVNIQDFCEEYYEDILPIIMDKIHRDKRKEVHARLDFGEGSRERRIRDGSCYSSARTLSARYHNQSERLEVRDRLRYNDRHVLDRLVHQRDRSRNISSPHKRDSSNGDRSQSRDCSRSVRESYDNFYSSYGTNHGYRYHDRDRSRWTAKVWFDELPPESIDSYKDLKAAFLAYFMQQKKYVKDHVEIHNIKQKDGETIRDFVERFKVETEGIKRAPECIRIFGFMHRVNNPELTKHLNEHVPKTMEEMMITTTAFIRGKATAAGKKKGHTSWRTQYQSKRHTSEKRSDFRGQPRKGRGSSRFTSLTRTPKEILAAKEGKFQPPPPMVTPVQKINSNKFCDFHNDKEHNTDECMLLKKQIKDLVRAGKLSHLIKEIKQGRDQSKVGKKETPTKDKPMEIYMIQSWQRMTRQKGLLVIEAEIGIHMIQHLYVDGGSSTEVLYEHCFNRLRLEVKNQMVSTTTSLTGFSRETIWPLGQLRLLVTIREADHSIRAWMNFMIVRSLSSYNGIIGRPRIKEIQAVPSTTHIMLKFPADGGIVTIRSTILIPAEYAMVITSSKEIPKEAGVRHENFKVALHMNFPDQEVAIRGTLSMKGCTKLCSLLKENLDIFAWQSSDMTGVPRSVAEARPRNARRPSKQRYKISKGEIMREVYYHDWLSNPVMRLVDKAFDSQIGQNIEVYVDDLVIKSHIEAKMLRDIGETFWIKPCPDKTEAVLQLPSPRTIKEVQSLNGKLASLNRFLSKSAEKSLPLFKTLKKCIKKSDFHWTSEAKQAFKQLKQHLSELPLLGDVSDASLLHKPRIIGPETELYPNEKASSITSFRSQEASESIMLKEHNITYRPRTSVKGQILADFLTEMQDESPPDASVVETQQEQWTLFTNRSSCVDGSGAGLILTSPKGTKFTYALRFQFAASNNEAEYEALIVSLWIAVQMGVQNVHISVDSKLVLNQVLEAYVGKEENMIKYLEKFKSLMAPIIEYLKEGTLPGDRKEASKLRIKARQYELLEGVLYRRSFLTPLLSKAPVVQWTRRKSKPELGERNQGPPGSGHTSGDGMPTYCTTAVDAIHNDEKLRLNLDLLEERCKRAAVLLSGQATLSTTITTLFMLWMEGSSVRSGKDLTR